METQINDNNMVIAMEEYKNIQILNLNKICSIMFLNKFCWHMQLEINSTTEVHPDMQCCGTLCHNYRGTIKSIVKPKIKYIINTFMTRSAGQNY